jgi:hypothetical protein
VAGEIEFTFTEHSQRLKGERLAHAAMFIQNLPTFPPSAEKMEFAFHYDDGGEIRGVVFVKQLPPKISRWKRILRKCRIVS